jgi:hypothetical protein
MSTTVSFKSNTSSGNGQRRLMPSRIAGLATSESQAAVGAENAVDQALAQKALRATDAGKPHE